MKESEQEREYEDKKTDGQATYEYYLRVFGDDKQKQLKNTDTSQVYTLIIKGLFETVSGLPAGWIRIIDDSTMKMRYVNETGVYNTKVLPNEFFDDERIQEKLYEYERETLTRLGIEDPTVFTPEQLQEKNLKRVMFTDRGGRSAYIVYYSKYMPPGMQYFAELPVNSRGELVDPTTKRLVL